MKADDYSRTRRRGKLLSVWDIEVGDLPNDGMQALTNWAGTYGVEVVVRAIQKIAPNEQFETSEDVLEAVKPLLDAWRKRGWC